jgi:opacity protein-like surface antigen
MSPLASFYYMARFHLFLGTGLVIAALHGSASAQGADDGLDMPSRMPNGASFDPDRATAPIRLVEGPGWKVNENTTFHPVIGLETGAISNVFFTNDSNCMPGANCVRPAGFLRVLAQIGVGSLTEARLTPSELGPEDPVTEQPKTSVSNPGSFLYRFDVRTAYDALLSEDSTVSSTGGLSLGATLRAVVHAVGPVSLWVLDDFERQLRAANFETDANTNRDINDLSLRVAYHPNDRTYGGFVYYANTVDVFERTQQQFADRMLNTIGIHPIWRWLPQTRVFADVSQGFNGGIGSSTKSSSYPTAFSLGVATLLSPMITLNAAAGYTWMSYSNGPSTSGVNASVALGYRYSELGRVIAQYQRTFEDSVNANFYQEHVIRVWGYHVNAPFVFSVQPELHFRDYVGTLVPSTTGSNTRSDTIFQLIAGVSYNLRNSLAVGLDYRFTDVSTDFKYMSGGATIDPSFARHSVLLGVRAAL